MADQEKTLSSDSKTSPIKSKRAPRKLGENAPTKQEPKPFTPKQDPYSNQEPEKELNSQEEQQEERPEPEPEPELEQKRSRRRGPRPSRSYSRESDIDSIHRSDIDSQPQPQQHQRTRRRRQPQQELQKQEDKAGNALSGLGGVDQAGELVQNTAGKAVSGVTDSTGKAVGGVLGGGKKDVKEENNDGGRDEQLRLRLDINLDIEIELKAKIHGDLTIGLLSVSPSFLFSPHFEAQKITLTI